MQQDEGELHALFTSSILIRSGRRPRQDRCFDPPGFQSPAEAVGLPPRTPLHARLSHRRPIETTTLKSSRLLSRPLEAYSCSPTRITPCKSRPPLGSFLHRTSRARRNLRTLCIGLPNTGTSWNSAALMLQCRSSFVYSRNAACCAARVGARCSLALDQHLRQGLCRSGLHVSRVDRRASGFCQVVRSITSCGSNLSCSHTPARALRATRPDAAPFPVR